MSTEEPTNKIADITASLKEFAARETELAKAELVPSAKNAAIGGGMFGTAGVFALHALWMLLIAGALTVGWAFDTFTALGTWAAFIWGFVTVAVISLAIAAILGLIGRTKFRQVKKPEATIAELQATIQALTGTLKKDEPKARTLQPETPDASRVMPTATP